METVKTLPKSIQGKEATLGQGTM